MAIRKPILSVQEARRLSAIRPDTGALGPVDAKVPPDEAPPIIDVVPPVPVPPAPKQVAFKPQPRSPISPKERPVAAAPPPPPPVSRVQVFVSAFVPSPGVSANFDQLSRQYVPEKALQMILRRALDDYEERLADGIFHDLPQSYASDGKLVVQTSRIMPRDLVDLSRAYFDPLGFESSRAFGQKLASAALAAFFAAEKKHR